MEQKAQNANTTYFHRLDPRVKMALLITFTIYIFTTRNFIVISAMFAAVVLMWGTARIPLSRIAGMIKFMIPIILFIVVVQALFQLGETDLVNPIIPKSVPVIGGIGRITKEGLIMGLAVSYRLITLILLMPLITYTTDIGRLALGLVKLGMPYKIAYIATTAFNMVPSMSEQVKDIMNAQKLRAFTVFENGKMLEKMKAYPALIIPMVVGAMKKSVLMGVAMDARAFGCSKKRTYVRDLAMRASDYVWLAGIVLFVAGLAVLNSVL
ncbi:MAG: energy-coupling factor transporter transmembrane component T [Bacillota bacterium]